MKIFNSFLFILFASSLVLGQIQDPLKAYITHFQSAEKNDEVTATALAAMHQFLSEKNEPASYLKEKLALEFKNKFGVSIQDAQKRSCQKIIDATIQSGLNTLSSIIELTRKLIEETRTQAENAHELVFEQRYVAYAVLYYAYLAINPHVSEDNPITREAVQLMHAMVQEFPEIITLDSELKESPSSEKALKRVVELSKKTVNRCFAGICIGDKKGIATLFGIMIAIPLLKKTIDLLKLFFTRPAAPGNNNDGINFGGDDDDGGDDDGNDGDENSQDSRHGENENQSEDEEIPQRPVRRSPRKTPQASPTQRGPRKSRTQTVSPSSPSTRLSMGFNSPMPRCIVCN